MAARKARIAVVGGGIAGLASAYFLQTLGYLPVVFEASERLGGLGTQFEYRGVTIDRFYHVILDSDLDLCALIKDLGLGDGLVWRETAMGFYLGGQLYALNTPLDLLRFRALSLLDRLRTGLGAFYITRLKRNALDLDNVYAQDWLRRIFGPRVFGRIWGPLLRAKFGERLDTVPAYWVWNTLNREKDGRQEVKGYLRGGYQALSDSLHRAIIAGNGEVRTSSPVASLDADATGVSVQSVGSVERFDAAISTLPLPVLRRVLCDSLTGFVTLPTVEYQGVVNAVVISRKQIDRFYWTIVVDPLFPFQGVVETTHVIPSEWVGNRHLIYLMNYCAADSELYMQPDDLVRNQAVDGLCNLYPHYVASDIEDVYVFRAPHVEPVWTVGYLRCRPRPRLDQPRLYLSTTAQAYPRVTAWNTSVALARESVAALDSDIRGISVQRLSSAA